MDSKALIERIRAVQATIAVIGMGYVGLPLTLAATAKKFRVLGFDTNPERIRQLNDGESPLTHIPGPAISAMRHAGLFEPTGDFARLREADAVLICVPTPLTVHREPDLSFLEQTAQRISLALRSSQIVVVESTSFPGTTRQVVKPILEQSGLKSGLDFLLAFSPEREDPGNASYPTSKIPKVIGGDGPDALAVAAALYGAFIEKVVPVSSTDTAEGVKILENVFRAVNIALVNELKVVYARMGIDIFEVIEAAKTKPFGFMPFYPGPGLGGHCIPIDPFYLTWKARQHGVNTRFIELAGEINSNMPARVVEQLAGAVDRHHGVGLTRSRILVVGAAYKKNVNDMRESPALLIIDLLEARGAQVDYYDPHVPVIPPSRDHPRLAGRQSIEFDPARIGTYAAVLIVTDHDAIDWETVLASARLVVDTRNIAGRLKGGGSPRANIVQA